MSHHDEARLDTKFTEFAKQMNLYLNHFPKHEKYGLAQTIRCKAYELYGFIVESQKRYQKKTSLTNADIAHEQLRMFIRLAYELGYFAFKDGSLIDRGAEPSCISSCPSTRWRPARAASTLSATAPGARRASCASTASMPSPAPPRPAGWGPSSPSWAMRPGPRASVISSPP